MAVNFFDLFGPSDSTVTGDDLSPEAFAFINAIADNESAGKWNVIYGGSTFNDYSKHPSKYVTIKSGPNEGEKSSAAGKYQITKTTYDRVAPKLGITDFSPESQMEIAWYLAQEKIPNLQQVLESGDPAQIQAAARKLNGVWTSLPGGIEKTQTNKGFQRAYDNHLNHPVPPGEIPELDSDEAVLSYVDYGRGPLLPTDLKRRSEKAIKRHDSIVREVSDLLKNGVVVPSGTRNLRNTAAQVIDFPAADLIAAGVAKAGLTAIPADPNGPLPKPSPLAPWANRPTAAGRVVAPGVIDVGGGGSSSSTTTASPTSTKKATPTAPVSGLRLPVAPALRVVADAIQKNQQPTVKAPVANLKIPIAPAATPKQQSSGSSNQMSPNDAALRRLVDKVTAQNKDTSVVKTTGGLAGSVAMPRNVRPNVAMPTTEPPSKKSTSTPAPKAVTTPKPASIAPIPPKTATNNAPVSLSNPVLKPVAKPSDPKPKTSSTQTTSKPVNDALLRSVEEVLKTPASTQPAKGQVIAAPAATKPVVSAPLPAAKKPAAVTQTPPIPLSRPATAKAPAKSGGILESGSAIRKAAAPAKGVEQADLKPVLGAEDQANAKIAGGVGKTKKPLSPLDIIGDIFLTGGEKTLGLIGDRLSGKAVRDQNEAKNAATIAAMSRGEPVTKVAANQATYGMTSAQAYDYTNYQSKQNAIANSSNPSANSARDKLASSWGFD